MAGCQLRVHAIQTWPGSTWLGLGFLRLGRGSSPAKAVQFLSHKHSVTLSRPTISCWVCKLSRVKSSLLETFSCYKPGIKRTCYKPGIKRSGNVPSKCLPCKRSLKMIIAPPPVLSHPLPYSPQDNNRTRHSVRPKHDKNEEHHNEEEGPTFATSVAKTKLSFATAVSTFCRRNARTVCKVLWREGENKQINK